MNKINTTLPRTSAIIALAGLALALGAMSLPLFAEAATYAYVDTAGEVKPVLADTWQQAIAKAPNIHIHSGVMLLDSPADFDIVGNDVSGY
jgi:membrane-bound ClpP family serine protease